MFDPDLEIGTDSIVQELWDLQPHKCDMVAGTY